MNARSLVLLALGASALAGAVWWAIRSPVVIETPAEAPVAEAPATGVVPRTLRPGGSAGVGVRDALPRKVVASPALAARLAAVRGDAEPPAASVAAELAGSLARWNGIVEVAVRNASPAHAGAVRSASAERLGALRALEPRIRADELDQAATREAVRSAWAALRADVPRVVPEPAAAQAILDGLAGPDGEAPFPR
jgi:hypothetical protein